MNWKHSIWSILLLSSLQFSGTPANDRVWSQDDSLQVRRIFDEALLRGQCYQNLHDLCKDIGHRLTGSDAAAEAVQWGYQVLLDMNLDSVYLQEITAPHWVRGDIETVRILNRADARLSIDLEACSLGGSVGTNGPQVREVIEVQSLQELANLPLDKIKNKWVFFNRPMDRSLVNTFSAYGGCVDQRYWGAATAAKYGAAGVIVRSMTTKTDHDPHTGSMGYDPDQAKIPAIAISTHSADQLHNALAGGRGLQVEINMDCETLADITTHNVIGEIRGIEDPDKVIVFGGHLDSWDKGEGAHDDGAGIVHTMEILRLFRAAGIRPRHTIRVVLFMNEENGNFGGKTYAANAAKSHEDHIVALESDRGGFTPRGFAIDGSDEQIAFIQSFQTLLEPYGLHYFEKGYAGVDIGPLKAEGNQVNPTLLMLGLYPDPQRYFDYHHSDEDVFEQVNQRELELGAASMASMVFLLDKYWEKIKS